MSLSDAFQHIEEVLQRALTLCQTGKFAEARVLYERLLDSYPRHPKALTNLAAIEFQAGNSERGLELIQRSIAVDADQPYAFYNAGNELLKLKRYEEALDYCSRAITLKPDFAEAYNNLGITLEKLERQNEALIHYDKAIALKTNYVEAYNNRGVILHYLRRFDESLASYQYAIALKPDYAKAYNNRGNLFKEVERFNDALDSYDQALKIAPDFAEAYFNRGVILTSLDRLDEAITAYDQAIMLRPGYADAYCNRGYALQQLNELEQALHNYNQAIKFDGEFPLAHWNKAFLLLLLGEYGEGWKLYEWRWETTQKEFRRYFSQPLWLGDPSIEGKTVLIYAEQGLGDFIQLCRYAPMIEEFNATVVLEVPAPLLSLMKSLKGNFTIIEKHTALPSFDLQCPVMSLPLAFNATLQTIPAGTPYLGVDENKKYGWQERLGNRTVLRVGLVWRGSPVHKNDHHRSIPLKQFEPLFQLPIEFHSLQNDINEEDAIVSATFEQLHWHHNDLADFSDTAALSSELDLIISVDTSVAHLAGALGRPVWILLPYAPDFRWMVAREDSPWYPTAKLFRQSAINDWSTVIADIANHLKQIGQSNHPSIN